MAASFHITNFGCRATQADGAALERELTRRGWLAADAGAAAVAILNTCTVTAAADADARATIRRIRRQNPQCSILVTGCYAQRAPRELAALPGVRWVLGNSHKHAIPELLSQETAQNQARLPFGSARRAANFVPLRALAPGAEILVSEIFAHTELLAAPVFEADPATAGRTRPILKVQDGCDNRCSFCVIPSVRGRSRSLGLADSLRQVRALVAQGYREVVLSGINLGRWGRDLSPRQRFADLVRALVDQTPLEKLRISSVEPMDWDDELVALVATHPRIARHAHLPLQSASDAVLRRMHRKYRPWHYAERVHKIRAAAPAAAIGADVMVGFPGETEAEFEESRAFIAALPFTYLHVFTFSARPGTPAAALPQQVPVELAHERNRILRELAAEKNLEFRRGFIGRELAAITLERQAQRDFTEAITDNYLKLRLRGEHAANQWITARIEALCDDGLMGAAT